VTQVVFLAAPGFQSVDSWLPLAVAKSRSSTSDIFIVFPRFWVLELIPVDDILVSIIANERFHVVCRLPLIGIYVEFSGIVSAIALAHQWRSLKRTLKISVRRPGLISFSEIFSVTVHLWRQFRILRRFQFSRQGILVWDLLNLAKESAHGLRSLIRATRDWTRISINLGPIYIEEPNLNGATVTERDYLLSFSPSQTLKCQKQYNLSPSQILPVTVPRHSPSWIQELVGLEEFVSTQQSDFVVLISRGSDPPLLTEEDRMEVLASIVRECCEIRQMRLLVKLHPNEASDEFGNIVKSLVTRFGFPENVASRIELTTFHPLLLGLRARLAVVYFSSTIADFAAVGCPVIQVLPLRCTDNPEVRRRKQLFDVGMATVVNDISQISTAVHHVLIHAHQAVEDQKVAYQKYFYSTDELSEHNKIEELFNRYQWR
jgi:hypothetical protein